MLSSGHDMAIPVISTSAVTNCTRIHIRRHGSRGRLAENKIRVSRSGRVDKIGYLDSKYDHNQFYAYLE